jgi:hypothetical protein
VQFVQGKPYNRIAQSHSAAERLGGRAWTKAGPNVVRRGLLLWPPEVPPEEPLIAEGQIAQGVQEQTASPYSIFSGPHSAAHSPLWCSTICDVIDVNVLRCCRERDHRGSCRCCIVVFSNRLTPLRGIIRRPMQFSRCSSSGSLAILAAMRRALVFGE